jgi:Sideroflexins
MPIGLNSDKLADENHDRTLFVSSAELERAKNLITAFKTGKIPSMNPEIWRAKKIVDSTIHPGLFGLRVSMASGLDSTDIPFFFFFRYRGARLSTISNVMLCTFQSRRDRWNAYSRLKGRTSL